MTVSKASRYTTSADETSGRVIAVPKQRKAVSYTSYVVRDGESLVDIAYKQFGDPQQWWRIAELNPSIDFPEPLVVGTVIRVPTP